MKNQICVANGVIVGHPNSAVAVTSGNTYCNFNLRVEPPGGKPSVIPMVAFKLTAEYLDSMTDGDHVLVQYNVGVNTRVNEYGEEQTNLNVYADEVYQTSGGPPSPVSICMGSVNSEPELKFAADGVATALLRVSVSNEWLSREGELASRESKLTFLFTGPAAEHVGQYVVNGTWVVVGFSIGSREYEGRDGAARYQPYLIGEWIEAPGIPSEQEFAATPVIDRDPMVETQATPAQEQVYRESVTQQQQAATAAPAPAPTAPAAIPPYPPPSGPPTHTPPRPIPATPPPAPRQQTQHQQRQAATTAAATVDATAHDPFGGDLQFE